MNAPATNDFAATAELETARALTDDELVDLIDAFDVLGATGAATERRGTLLTVTATVTSSTPDEAATALADAAVQVIPGATVLEASAQTYDELDI